jgi:hypothetical protein
MVQGGWMERQQALEGVAMVKKKGGGGGRERERMSVIIKREHIL